MLLVVGVLLLTVQRLLSQSHTLENCLLTINHQTVYDFNQLIDPKLRPFNLTTTKPTPPSTTIESILLSPCKKLPYSTVHPTLSCPDGTLICILIYNSINHNDPTLQQIIPVAVDHPSPILQINQTEHKPSAVRMAIKGAIYNDIQQTTSIDFICSERAERPTTIYDPIQGELKINWLTPIVCPSPSSNLPHQQSPTHPFKNFFFFLLVLFFGYLTIGMWYNYNAYGLTGSDALPHKTFWDELPRMMFSFIRSSPNLFGSRRSTNAGRAEYTPL